MNIKDDHLYHGAALTQIAEDDQFTAINPIDVRGKRSRSAFLVNANIAIYLKYDSVGPKGYYEEFKFTFTEDHLEELKELAEKHLNVFAALVCLKKRGIPGS